MLANISPYALLCQSKPSKSSSCIQMQEPVYIPVSKSPSTTTPDVPFPSVPVFSPVTQTKTHYIADIRKRHLTADIRASGHTIVLPASHHTVIPGHE